MSKTFYGVYQERSDCMPNRMFDRMVDGMFDGMFDGMSKTLYVVYQEVRLHAHWNVRLYAHWNVRSNGRWHEQDPLRHVSWISFQNSSPILVAKKLGPTIIIIIIIILVANKLGPTIIIIIIIIILVANKQSGKDFN